MATNPPADSCRKAAEQASSGSGRGRRPPPPFIHHMHSMELQPVILPGAPAPACGRSPGEYPKQLLPWSATKPCCRPPPAAPAGFAGHRRWLPRRSWCATRNTASSPPSSCARPAGAAATSCWNGRPQHRAGADAGCPGRGRRRPGAAGDAGRPCDRRSRRFPAAIDAGIPAARDGAIVTFGIVPDRPRRYGYIRWAPTGDGSKAIAAFVEKPDAATAQRYLDSGEYLWNSGIHFMVRASTWPPRPSGARSPRWPRPAPKPGRRARDADFVRWIRTPSSPARRIPSTTR